MQALLLSFPLFALLASLVAVWQPSWFAEQKSFIIPLLMLIMLGMGMTLKRQDFQLAWQLRKLVVLGVGLQFLVMPLAAWILSLVFNLSLALTIGMILVGTTAGGTASNVITYLAKGHLPLSISMTTISTLVATVAMPFLTWLLLDKSVDVPVASLLWSLLQIIVLPLILGMWLNHYFETKLEAIKNRLPLISMIGILWIIAIIVALNSNNLSSASWLILLVVILHNLIGMASGYLIPRLLGYDSVIARTIAIEVGMQNSGLSVALALKYFSSLAALPGAIFSIWHNISGAMFAAYWHSRKQPDHHDQAKDRE